MKKTNSLLTFLAMFFGLSLVFSSQYILAQDAEDSKEVKVKIVQKINGDTKTIEKVFSIEDEDALKELLKEYDLNIDADDVLKDRQVEISIRKSDDSLDDKEVEVKINRYESKSGDVSPRAFLGVFVEDNVEENVASNSGAVVSEVIKETPAEKAGLQNGDVITKVNDLEITGSEQFRETIRSFKPGEKIAITYLRDGKQNNVSVTLNEKKGGHPFPMFKDEDLEWNGQLPPMHPHFPEDMKNSPFLGIVPANSEINIDGVHIGEVVEKSTAEEIGLKKGDVITSINDKPVQIFDELRKTIQSMKPGDDVKVKYQRDGQAAESSGKLKSKADRNLMYFDWQGKMPPCYNPSMRNFHGWNEDKEITKEEIAGRIEGLEQEIQKLKEQLNQLNNTGSLNDREKKTEETKITITIEDVSKNNLAAENLFFSPNPNNGKFNLSFELPDKGKTTVKIFDVNNKEIYNESLGKFSGRYDRQIDVSENPKGIYFLQITQDNKALNKKIVIQ